MMLAVIDSFVLVVQAFVMEVLMAMRIALLILSN